MLDRLLDFSKSRAGFIKVDWNKWWRRILEKPRIEKVKCRTDNSEFINIFQRCTELTIVPNMSNKAGKFHKIPLVISLRLHVFYINFHDLHIVFFHLPSFREPTTTCHLHPKALFCCEWSRHSTIQGQQLVASELVFSKPLENKQHRRGKWLEEDISMLMLFFWCFLFDVVSEWTHFAVKVKLGIPEP